jgi:hypothetical protein
MLPIVIALHVAAVRAQVLARRRSDAGQTTAEYALVLLGSAAIALLVLAWATQTNKIGRLLDAIVDSLMDKIA